MATLQRIRNHSVFLLVVVGLAMAAFIIGDLLTSSSSIMQSSRDKVVTVNGKKVTYEEFEAARTRRADLYKTLFGYTDTDNATLQRINTEVYNDFVLKVLLDEVAEETGLNVTDEEMNELVQGSHTSSVLKNIFTNPQNGQYMGEAVQFWVNLVINDSFEEEIERWAQQGRSFPEWATPSNWMVLEGMIRQARMQEKYNALLAAAVAPNKLEAEERFAGDNVECSFAYAQKDLNAVGDSIVKVGTKEVRKIYDATKYNYKRPATRTVSYIAVPLRPSADDIAAVGDELNSIKEEFSTADDIEDLVNSGSNVPYADTYFAVRTLEGDMRAFVEQNETGAILDPALDGTTYSMARIMGKKTAPDSVDVSAIVVYSPAKADSIMRVLASPKADFATVASETCDIPQLAESKGAFGWMTEAAATQAFGRETAEKIFDTKAGRIVRNDVEANGMTSCVIAMVNEATAPVAKAKIAVYAIEVVPSSTTRRNEYGRLNNFLTANKTIEAMQDSARGAGYAMRPTTLYPTYYSIGTVADARQAVRFAFQNKPGKVSEIFECGDNLIVVAVTGATEEGYVTPKDSTVYRSIERTARQIAKSEKVASDLSSIADKSLSGYAAAMESKIDTAVHVNFNLASRITGIGVEPKVIAAALQAEPGAIVGPIAGQNKVVVLALVDKQEKGLTYDEQASRQAVANGTDYRATQSPLSVLVNHAEIEDNRISMY